jgi:hypothetical protein
MTAHLRRCDLGLHNEDTTSSDATQRGTCRLVIRGEVGDRFAFSVRREAERLEGMTIVAGAVVGRARLIGLQRV